MLPAVVGLLVFSVVAIFLGALSSHVRQSRHPEGIPREKRRDHDSASPFNIESKDPAEGGVSVTFEDGQLSRVRQTTLELNDLLELARKHTMTPEEIEEQRQSWVRGEMALGTDADERERKTREGNSMELSKKHRRNLLLNELGYAVASLRAALQIADEDGLEIAIDIEDEIDEVIKISNNVEMEYYEEEPCL